MDDLTTRLSQLGRTVADVSDAAADPTTLPNARRRWLSSTIPPPKPRRWLVPAVSFAAALGVVVTLFFAWPRERALAFSVGADAPGAVGQWVAPESAAPTAVRFSEGTVVTVAEGARLRVTETTAQGATLLIERGAIHAAIVHRSADTRWSVQAGPFVVRVTGTAFDARWDPASETFELTMLEGSVMVSGPRLPSERVVVAGEQLTVSQSRMELRAGASATPTTLAPAALTATAEPPATAAPAAPDASGTAAPALSGAPAPSASSSAAPEASWRTLARSGKYKDAMEAAEAAGFSAEVARGSAADLQALADAARFAGRPARAKEALLSLRRRFGARGSSAFLLGKIAADQLGSPGEAVTWFETYLQEESGGGLAEQALGRIIEIRKRDPGAARPAAERYLARYPNGAYAALARSIVGPR